MGVARSARYFTTAKMSKARVFTENLRKLFKMWEKTKASLCMLRSRCSAAHLELCPGADVAGSEEGPRGHGWCGWEPRGAARGGLWGWVARAPLLAGRAPALPEPGPHPGRCV